MSNIEPTEEQKQAAQAWAADEWGPDVGFDSRLARLLAEREAKLSKQLAFMEAGSLADYNAFAEALQKEDAYLAEINLINERLAEMREVDGRKSRMLYDRDVIIDTLRARVAELEAKQARLKHLANDEVAACGVHIDSLEKLLAASTDREAQHLADIKALRVDLSDACDELCAVVRYDAGENYGGPYNVDNAELVRAQLARRILATAHYDDAKAGAPATCPKCTDDARPVGDGERWVCSVCRRPCRVPLNDAEGGEG